MLKGVAGQSKDAILSGTQTTLFTLIKADMNVTTDQTFTKVGSFTNYIITQIVCTAASISLTTAQGGIYTGANKTGTVIVAATQAYSAQTTANSTLTLTLNNTDQRSATPILSLTTPQGAAATNEFRVLGFAVS